MFVFFCKILRRGIKIGGGNYGGVDSFCGLECSSFDVLYRNRV